MYKISYITIYIDTNRTNFRHIGYFKTDLRLNASSGDFLTTLPNDFNILSSSKYSTGYDEHCVIGINSMIVAASSNNFTRTLWFNATTNPISDKSNDVYETGGVY
jgi:hypothetical protein